MSDFLPFKVVPVAGYDDIVAANDNFLQGRDQVILDSFTYGNLNV